MIVANTVLLVLCAYKYFFFFFKKRLSAHNGRKTVQYNTIFKSWLYVKSFNR